MSPPAKPQVSQKDYEAKRLIRRCKELTSRTTHRRMRNSIESATPASARPSKRGHFQAAKLRRQQGKETGKPAVEMNAASTAMRQAFARGVEFSPLND